MQMTDDSVSVTRKKFLAAIVGISTGFLGHPTQRPEQEDTKDEDLPSQPGKPESRDTDPDYDRFCQQYRKLEATDDGRPVFLHDEKSMRTFFEITTKGHISFIQPCERQQKTVLRVDMPKGDHYGTSLRYRFQNLGLSQPVGLTSQYSLYFSPNFRVQGTGGKLPGPAGTYGQAGWGGRPANGKNGWSARALFKPSGNSDYPIQLAYYAYHADMEDRFGDVLEWTKGGNGQLARGRWYHLKETIKLNTPGENDGVLRGWVDGQLAFERTDMRFRDIADLKIQEFWFNVYYGGNNPSPSKNSIYFDTLSLSLEPSSSSN